jgi:hypothetical protein
VIGRRKESLRGPSAEPAQRFPLPQRRLVTHPGQFDQRRLATERGPIRIDSEWLFIDFSDEGVVERVWLYHD